MNVSREMLLAFLPLVAVNYSLAIYCVVDMLRREPPKFLPKMVWILIVLFIQIFGSVAYLTFGRNHETTAGR